MTFDTILQNYKRGLWNIDMVRMAVIRDVNGKTKGIITKDQFYEITGREYEE